MSSQDQSNLTRISLEEEVPRLRRVDFKSLAARSELYFGARFIFECGQKLSLGTLTLSTAASLFHRFFKQVKKEEYDQYLIASSCLYLAGKMEEADFLKLRDLINVVHTTLHRRNDDDDGDDDQASKSGKPRNPAPLFPEPPELGSEYYNIREAICQAELLILRVVKFQVKIEHPHKYLLHYLKTLKDWMSDEDWREFPVAQTSWSMLQDLYHDPRVLDMDNVLVSLACLRMTLQTYGLQVPMAGDTDKNGWFTVFSEKATKNKLWEIETVILDVYNKDATLVEPNVFVMSGIA